MQRGELALTACLVALLLAGAAYESWRGGPKNAEVIVTHPVVTPFETLSPNLIPSPAHPSASSIVNATQTQPTPTPPAENALLILLNQGDVKQLEQLPGVGETMAARIIQYRADHGPFREIEQLLEVSGIGPSKFNQIVDYGKRLASRYPTPFPPPPFFRFPAATPVYAPRVSPLQPQAGLSLNRATKEQLMTVNGIGDALAESLLAERERRRGFKSWEEVKSVPGFGEKRLEALQKQFTLK